MRFLPLIRRGVIEPAWISFIGESLFKQVQSTMLITVFVFLGIEGASVCPR